MKRWRGLSVRPASAKICAIPPIEYHLRQQKIRAIAPIEYHLRQQKICAIAPIEYHHANKKSVQSVQSVR